MADVTLDMLGELMGRVHSEVRALRDDVRDLSRRVSALEQQLLYGLAAQASTSARIDGLVERVDRIERRLELRDEG